MDMDSLDSLDLSQETFNQFGLELVAPLGGRLNKHWLVKSPRPPQERFVLRRWSTPSVDDVAYELRLLARVAALGWPVPCPVGDTQQREGHFWNLFTFLPGEPPPNHGSLPEQRARGRLLAEFHGDLAQLHEIGQRQPWRRGEAILADPMLDRVLSEHERAMPEDIAVLRWHLHRARERVAGIPLHDRADIIVHGDFTPWNLRFEAGRLCGILDFELSHRDHRVADFALSWRGKYDGVIHGYDEVAPLEPEEWALITPLWWSSIIDGVCRDLVKGIRDDGWSIQKLLLRCPVMGPDAEPYR